MTMELKCECGGSLRPTTLHDFDFSAYAGLPVRVLGAPGLECSKCEGETLEGEVIDKILEKLALVIMRKDHQLSSLEMKFLRKRMRLTQAKLAEKLGIVRETLADWERGASTISPQYDFMVRAIFASHLMHSSDKQLSKSVADVVAQSIQSVRREPALPVPAPYIIDQALGRMRNNDLGRR